MFFNKPESFISYVTKIEIQFKVCVTECVTGKGYSERITKKDTPSSHKLLANIKNGIIIPHIEK